MKTRVNHTADGSVCLLDLGDALEFMRLIWAVDHGLQRTSKSMASSVGVTGPQRLVVRMVGRFPGISAGRLSAILHVHPSTSTGVLRRLVKRGLLKRRPDPRDGRRVALDLTPKGRWLDAETPGTVESAVRQVLASLSPGEVRAARHVMRMLAHKLETAATNHRRRR